jgi:endoglucanase
MIHVAQTGYRPGDPKRGYSLAPLGPRFSLVDVESGRAVFEGPVVAKWDAHLGMPVSLAEFTAWSTPGQYRLRSGGAESVTFVVTPACYRQLARLSLRSYAYLRCGTAVDDPDVGIIHGPCHTAAALDYERPTQMRVVLGGWHDAGDYGRYVPTGAVSVAVLLLTADLLGLPRLPDDHPIWDTVRPELQFLSALQDPDGGVHHKIASERFCGMVVPEADSLPLVLYPVHSGSTAQFSAAAARAARLGPREDPLVPALRARSLRAWEWLATHPPRLDIPVGETGAYLSPTDDDKRFWAAAELWALTHEDRFRDYLENHWPKASRVAPFGWADTWGLGVATLAALDSHDPLVTHARRLWSETVRSWVDLTGTNAFGVALGPDEYHWASAKVALTRGLGFLLEARWSENREWAHHAVVQLQWVVGQSPLGQSLVTGIGPWSTRHLHHRYTVATGRLVPGLLAGGPNADGQDGIAPKGRGPLSYVDDHRAYSANENAIDYNAPLVALAWALDAGADRVPPKT